MSIDQWIQIIVSGALFLATSGLVIVTLNYAKSTKRMAKSMELQSKIMFREFEFRVTPIIRISPGRAHTSHQEGRYHYLIENNGSTTIILKSVKAYFRERDKDVSNIPTLEKEYNLLISPADPKEIILKVNFSDMNRLFPDVEAKKNIVMLPYFYIENIEHKEFPFEIGERTVWQ